MKWVLIFLFIGGALALGRIALSLRQLRSRKVDDWDTKLIERLRRGGADPFAAHEVGFFLAMPAEPIARRAAERLSGEGFTVDVREVPDNTEHPFSVHAMKSMQLNADSIREVSARLRQIAADAGGRYDGWAAGRGTPPG